MAPATFPSRKTVGNINGYLDTVDFKNVQSFQVNPHGVVIPASRQVYIAFDGQPQAQQRPRRGNGGVFYDPDATFKNSLRSFIRLEGGNSMMPFPQDALDVNIDFGVANMQQKDIDNMMKLVFDVLQGVIYANDHRIHRVTAQKRQDDVGYTRITIKPLVE